MLTNAAFIIAKCFACFFHVCWSVPQLWWLSVFDRTRVDDIGSVSLPKFVPTGVSEAVRSQFHLFQLLAASFLNLNP